MDETAHTRRLNDRTLRQGKGESVVSTPQPTLTTIVGPPPVGSIISTHEFGRIRERVTASQDREEGTVSAYLRVLNTHQQHRCSWVFNTWRPTPWARRRSG